MKTTKYLLTTLVIWVLGMSMEAQEKSPCSYISEINDQNIEEFALSDYFYDNASKFYYKVVNDKSLMAVIIKMDKDVGKGLFMRGLEIWLNSGSKRKKTDGIKFPLPQMPDFKNGSHDGPTSGAEFKIQSSEMEITGFGNDKVQIIPSDNSKFIHGKIEPDKEGMICYQVIIPLDKLKSIIDINKAFAVLIKSPEFKRPENGPPMGDRPPRPEMGDGPPPGGRPGGMPGMGGPGQMIKNVEIMLRGIVIHT